MAQRRTWAAVRRESVQTETERRAYIATTGRRLGISGENTASLVDQVRTWEQDEPKTMEQERLERSGSRQHLDHLKRKVTEQEVHEGSSGSD
jgi:hypothetical protein